jgi:hypothetical protein
MKRSVAILVFLLAALGGLAPPSPATQSGSEGLPRCCV